MLCIRIMNKKQNFDVKIIHVYNLINFQISTYVIQNHYTLRKQ